MSSFEKYSDILLEAFQSNFRHDDISLKKKEILDDVFAHYDIEPVDILFVGFSPGILKSSDRKISVTLISKEVIEFLNKSGVRYDYINFDDIKPKQFSVVIAADEYFTFAISDTEQRNLVESLISISRDFIITTLRDYKNQDFKEKEFSHPVIVKGQEGKKIFFEHYDYDMLDKNVTYGTNYIIDDDSLLMIGPFTRRAMYFKQLAKFSLDAGAVSFLVHKNLMHKSIIKRNYEHIITIKI